MKGWIILLAIIGGLLVCQAINESELCQLMEEYPETRDDVYKCHNEIPTWFLEGIMKCMTGPNDEAIEDLEQYLSVGCRNRLQIDGQCLLSFYGYIGENNLGSVVTETTESANHCITEIAKSYDITLADDEEGIEL